jgi:hypothetical protein
MFILASVCWAIWNVHIKITFGKYTLKSPSLITFYSISLLIYWAGLQKLAADKEKMSEGAHKVKQVATSVYSRQAQTTIADSHQLAMVAST